MKGKLTAHFVRDVRHSGKVSAAGRPRADHHQDGGGLYLQVLPSGTKTWIQRIALNGRRSDYGLGSLADLGLLEARAVAAANLAQAAVYRTATRRGERPPVPEFEARRQRTVARRTGQVLHGAVATGLTFADAWEACIAERSKDWRNAATALRSWRADLRIHLARLARRPVASITVDELRAVFTALPPATASKVLRRTGTVFGWAVAGGHRTDNPATALRESRRGLNGHAKAHRQAMPWADVPAFYARLRVHGTDGAAGALALVTLTALRSGEASGARWEEIDLDGRTWTVPGERMKDGRAHRVPLSGAACAVLRAAGPREGGRVFSAPRGGTLRDKDLRAALAAVAGAGTVHGLRSTFRDWCGEQAVARELAEACLAHQVGSSVEQAYARSDLFKRRADVMERWARHVAGAD